MDEEFIQLLRTLVLYTEKIKDELHTIELDLSNINDNLDVVPRRRGKMQGGY